MDFSVCYILLALHTSSGLVALWLFTGNELLRINMAWFSASSLWISAPYLPTVVLKRGAGFSVYRQVGSLGGGLHQLTLDVAI